MRRTITAEDKKILDRYSDHMLTLMISGGPVKRRQMFVPGKTQINGGTAYYGRDNSGSEYTEDDLVDENGLPYMMPVTEFGNFLPDGARVIVVINGDVIFLMSCKAELTSLIPASAPQGIESGCHRICHQNELRFKDPSVPDAPARISRFTANYINNNAHLLRTVMAGVWFFGFMGWIIIVFAAYGYIFQYTPLGDKYFSVGVPLIPVLTVLTAVAAKRIYKGRIRARYADIKSVRKAILLRTNINMMVPNARDFIVAEQTLTGEMKINCYIASNAYDAGDAADMKPGQIIYKYAYGDNGFVFFGSR